MNTFPNAVRLAVAAAILCAAAASAQIPANRPQFDAASVRINESSDRPSTRYDPARVELHKASIKHLVRRAWPVPDYQVVWPSWVGERGAMGYDVSVTFPSSTSEADLKLMFADLLTTRFGLAMHWETRDLKVYEVSVSPKGLKLREAVNPAPPTDYPKYSVHTGKGEWQMSSKLGGAPSGLSVAGLLEMISANRILDRPLVDATGITGYFDIDLTAPAEAPDNKPAPSELLSALEKQLGLKATPRTIPTPVLVIDHLERIPTEN